MMYSSLMRVLIMAAAICTLVVNGRTADNGWPREVPLEGGKALVYLPQLESLEENRLTGRAAVSLQLTTMTEPMYGAVWFDATVKTNHAAKTIDIQKVTIPRIRIPELDQVKSAEFARALESRAQAETATVSLDRVLEMLKVGDKLEVQAADLRNDPPEIQFIDSPAVLVKIDGAPVIRPVENTGLSRVANTPFFIVQSSEKKWYLRGGEFWFSAADPLGPWALTSEVPAPVLKAASNAFAGEPDAIAPGDKQVATKPKSADPKADIVPEIIVTTGTMELIETEGEPVYKTIPGTKLDYISNSKSDVFVDDTRIYALLSGRWFATDIAGGPWEYVAAKDLPADFRKIPKDSPKASVLASIPGTDEAQTAVLDAAVPKVGAVSRKDAKLEVEYDGEPQFKPIEDTPMTYATNTEVPVVNLDDTYYACDNGAWYQSSGATGPWTVSTSVPDTIYTIPPSCPIYHTRYVRVYDYTPDYVYAGYTPGYCGSYVYGGALVYGTGYYYEPWIGSSYYARPCTWGFGVGYNSWSDDWSWGIGYNGIWGNYGYAGYGWIASGWGYGNPWCGPVGYRPWYGGYYDHHDHHDNHYSHHDFYDKPWHRPDHHRPGQHRPDFMDPDYDRPGHDRPWARPGHDRESAENRPGNRPGNRPDGEDRPGANTRPGQDGRPGVEQADAASRPKTRPSLESRRAERQKGNDRERVSTRPGNIEDRRRADAKQGDSTRTRPDGKSTGRDFTRDAKSTKDAKVSASDRRNDLVTDRAGNVYRRDNNGWQTREQGKWTRTSADPGNASPGNASTRRVPKESTSRERSSMLDIRASDFGSRSDSRPTQYSTRPTRTTRQSTQSDSPSLGSRQQQYQRNPSRLPQQQVQRSSGQVNYGSLNRDSYTRSSGAQRSETYQRAQRSPSRQSQPSYSGNSGYSRQQQSYSGNSGFSRQQQSYSGNSGFSRQQQGFSGNTGYSRRQSSYSGSSGYSRQGMQSSSSGSSRSYGGRSSGQGGNWSRGRI